MTAETAPIFVLCCARSGSTLLRYVLDTHPQIVAPPELHLLLMARQLAWVYEHTATTAGCDEAVDATSYATEHTRATVSSIMHEYAARAGKRIWAEKSVSSVDCIDVLQRLYPDARLISLYRQAPDVMASCAQAGQQRAGTFGFEPFVARTPANPIDGLADYWVDKTRRTLDAERRLSNPLLRLRYEDLVREPAATIEQLFGFLGLVTPAGMLDSVFSTAHVVGPGDNKILTATGIHTGSIGHGSRLAMDRLSPDRRERIDALHAALGYPKPGAAT